ncbi:YoaK family protein [Peribacillus kribbensis]|uniref:YoaK family protein n=1 Tax=Peribacillus kribbensis TaxID=356658 RepID=UPI0004189FE7|nr:YoaK family protein [Peribacillus kribbensis]
MRIRSGRGRIRLSSVRNYIYEKREKLPPLTAESVGLGILLAAVGGFLDAYTYISRDGVFATSQTGNLVLLGIKLSQGKWHEGLAHIPPMIAFVFGVIVAEYLKHPHIIRLFPYPARTVLLVESIVLFIVGTWPPEVPSITVTITVAFAASVQLSAFRTLVKWPYNSAIVTGNLRTASQAAYVAVMEKDREAALKCLDFSLIILGFLGGALTGTVSTLHFGTEAIWIASGILILALAVIQSNPKKLLVYTKDKKPK